MLSGLSGFLATVTGKVVLTGAVAAASVGGLHAGDVVDVPGLPDNDPPAAEQAANADDNADAQNDDLPDEATEGQQTAEEKQAAAEAYTTAVQDWTDCVSEHAAAQGDETTSTTGEFDPRSECDDRPTPQDFGLTEVPDQADQDGVENSEEGRENAPDDPEARGDETRGDDESGDDPTSNDPTGNSEQGEEQSESTGDDDDADDASANGSESGSTGTDTADAFRP